MKPNPDALESNLNQVIGTESYHRYLGGVVLTDGAKYFAEQAGAFWLMDILATQPEIRELPFAHAKLHVSKDETGKLVVTDGNDNVKYRRTLGFTDCPPGTWTFFITNGVIMVPSEY